MQEGSRAGAAAAAAAVNETHLLAVAGATQQVSVACIAVFTPQDAQALAARDAAQGRDARARVSSSGGRASAATAAAHLEPPSLDGPLLALAALPDGAMAGGWRLSGRRSRVQSRRRLCGPPAAARHPGRHLAAAVAASAPAKSRGGARAAPHSSGRSLPLLPALSCTLTLRPIQRSKPLHIGGEAGGGTLADAAVPRCLPPLMPALLPAAAAVSCS